MKTFTSTYKIHKKYNKYMLTEFFCLFAYEICLFYNYVPKIIVFLFELLK